MRPILSSLIALPLASAGCSLLQVRAPPQVAPRWPAQMQCTRESSAPVIDLVTAVVLAPLAIGALASTSAQQCPSNQGFGCAEKNYDSAFGVGALVGASIFALSAAYGYSSVARCRNESDARVVANWIPPSPPWDSRVSATRLSLADAQQYCRGRNLSLPLRDEAVLLALQQRMPIVVWTGSTSNANSDPDDPPKLEPVAVDLGTGGSDRRTSGDELRALCIAH